MALSASATGTLVKRLTTSKLIIMSSSSSWISLMGFAKSLEFLTKELVFPASFTLEHLIHLLYVILPIYHHGGISFVGRQNHYVFISSKVTQGLYHSLFNIARRWSGFVKSTADSSPKCLRLLCV